MNKSIVPAGPSLTAVLLVTDARECEDGETHMHAATKRLTVFVSMTVSCSMSHTGGLL